MSEFSKLIGLWLLRRGCTKLKVNLEQLRSDPDANARDIQVLEEALASSNKVLERYEAKS